MVNINHSSIVKQLFQNFTHIPSDNYQNEHKRAQAKIQFLPKHFTRPHRT